MVPTVYPVANILGHIRPATPSEKQEIEKACAKLYLPWDRIDFTASRVQDAKDAVMPLENLFDKTDFGNLSEAYVPVLIQANKDWNLDRLKRMQSQAQKKDLQGIIAAKRKREDTKAGLFSRYFKSPDRENTFVALVTDRPERSLAEQMRWVDPIVEPLLTQGDDFAILKRTLRESH